MNNNINNLLGGVTYAFSSVVSTVVTTAGTTASSVLYMLGSAPIQAAEQAQEVEVSIAEAFQLAEEAIQKPDLVTAKKYYDIVIASTQKEDEMMKFKARCRLALAVSGVVIDNISSHVDDPHGMLLRKVEEVNRYLFDINSMAPIYDAVCLETTPIQYFRILGGAFQCQRALIEKGLREFADACENLPDNKLETIQNRWRKWENLTGGFNFLSAWFNRWNKRNQHTDLVLPTDQYYRVISEVCEQEFKRIKAIYESSALEQEDEFEGVALSSADVYSMLKPVGHAMNTANIPESFRREYNAFMGKIARKIGMQKYAAFERQPESVETNAIKKKEYAEIYTYLFEADTLAPSSATSLSKAAFEKVKRELDSVSVECAARDSNAFLALLNEQVNLYIVDKENPEEIVAQVAWLEQASAILNDPRLSTSEAAPAFSAADKRIKDHILNRKDAFKACIERTANDKTHLLIMHSLLAKKNKIAIVSMRARFWIIDPNNATFDSADKESLARFLNEIFKNTDVMWAFHSATSVERETREVALKEYLVGVYKHEDFRNNITLHPNILNDITKKDIQDTLKLSSHASALKVKIK
jgi:hypothetical protein